ncbi:P-loop containing nucleoside triphosphate hydrolase protein, partial [Truncatella angustata]
MGSDDRPGQLSSLGPRHDNDHANITDIRILPTTNEILSTRYSYIPVYDPSKWHLQGIQGLLDRHFRLLREDNLGPVRDVVRTHLQGSSCTMGMYQDNSMSANEYKVQNLRVAFDMIDGFGLHIAVRQPIEVASRRTPAHREQWWIESQNIDWERLVCVISKGYVMFCVVSRATCRTLAQLNEKRDKSKKKRIRPADLKASDVDFMLNLRHSLGAGSIVVEFPTLLLASFKPMLCTLQHMSTHTQVPMGEYLVGSSGNLQDNSKVDEHIPPPTYATNTSFQFDLRPVIRDQTTLLYSAQNEPNVEELCARSDLDTGQAESLLNSLRRQLALIQGPPGTGKSYTGEAIIDVLLANKAKANLGPIICICQTNHALDQLLEHLYLRKNIKRVVRLGSQSKSDVIGGLTLQNIMDLQPMTEQEMMKRGRTSKKRRSAAKRVIEALAELETAEPQKSAEITRAIHDLNQTFETHVKAVDATWSERKVNILRGYDVIGVTTSGLARFREFVGQLKSKVVICEEAGEVLESHTLGALMPHTQHLILIGDHQQLRPTTNNWAFQVANPDGRIFSFDMSLFERLVKPLLLSDKRLPFDTLEVQRRMHPVISDLVRSTMYPKLQDAENVKRYPGLAGFKRRLFWFHHSKPEDGSNINRSNEFSFSNRFEIEVVKTVLSHLTRQNVYGDGEIAVLTPYAGQLRQLKIQLGTTYDISMNELDAAELERRNMMVKTGGYTGRRRIRVATVDNFQGEEASVVIISLVRSNAERRCGFLNQSNRINVLLSRAKHGMIIIGNAETYSLNDMWWEIIQMMQNNGNIGPSFELECPRHKDKTMLASSAQQFFVSGCDEECGKPL